ANYGRVLTHLMSSSVATTNLLLFVVRCVAQSRRTSADLRLDNRGEPQFCVAAGTKRAVTAHRCLCETAPGAGADTSTSSTSAVVPSSRSISPGTAHRTATGA